MCYYWVINSKGAAMTTPLSIPLADYVGKVGNTNEVARTFDVCGQTVRAAINAGREMFVRVDPVTDQAVDVIEIKKVWTAVAK